MLMSLEPGKPVVSKTTFTPYEIDPNQGSAPTQTTPSIRTVGTTTPSGTASACASASAPVNAPTSAPANAPVSAPAIGGYVPKQGKMTVEDVEEELEMLMKRMEFLSETLQQLRKENAKDM